jgi:hypothetical protein
LTRRSAAVPDDRSFLLYLPVTIVITAADRAEIQMTETLTPRRTLRFEF